MVGDVNHPENYRDNYGSQAVPTETGFDAEKAKALFDEGYAENGNTPINIETQLSHIKIGIKALI